MIANSIPDYVLITCLTVASIVLIIVDHRLDFERNLRQRYGVDRDWWIPPLAFAVAAILSVIGMPAVIEAFNKKFEILVLIFSFGIMSEGLGASGFFRYISYKVVDKCEGNTARLVLYLYIMTSVITLFTTNDIVVLVVTPIIVTICFQAGIRNTKLILLSQFIAANTLSMGMLIGSPTNLIIGESTNIDFFGYLLLMLLPAIVSFIVSFLIIDRLIALADSERGSWFADLEFQEKYSMPATNPEPYFTPQMRNWILIFTTFVTLVALVTYYRLSLLWCAVSSILISLTYWWRSEEHDERILEPLKRLPYGIFFFGMTFFVFAEQLSRTQFINRELVPLLGEFFAGEPVRAAIVGVYGSGVLVNVFNDLPAAAIIAKLLEKLAVESFVIKHLLIQSTLVGLNIGTYLTPVGALAGLIWFNQLRLERRKQRAKYPELASRMMFPKRIDLLRFGTIHFLITGLFTGTFLIFEWVLLSFLVGPYVL